MHLADAYKILLTDLYINGTVERNERTGADIKVLGGGYSFRINLFNNELPLPTNRAYYPHVAAAEVAWQFLGTKNPEFILRYAPKLWSKFLEDDEIKAAYGYRWKEHFNRDQLVQAVYELSNNPTNRQLWITAWDPATDGLGSPDQPMNIPCPIGFAVNIVGGKLHASLFIRSSDTVVGLPYDVQAYVLTLNAMRNMVNKISNAPDIQMGTLHVTLAHAHYYMQDDEIVRESLRNFGRDELSYKDVSVSIPNMTMAQIEAYPDVYVEAMKINAREAKKPAYNPKPEVVV